MTVTQPAPRSADTTALAALERAMGALRKACQAAEDAVTPWTGVELLARNAIGEWDKFKNQTAWREAAKMEGGSLARAEARIRELAEHCWKRHGCDFGLDDGGNPTTSSEPGQYAPQPAPRDDEGAAAP